MKNKRNLISIIGSIVLIGILSIYMPYGFNREKKRAEKERIKNEYHLFQIDSVYKKMKDVKDLKSIPAESEEGYNKLWAEYYKLNEKADSIKNLLPQNYQYKADSIREKVLDWD